MIPYDFHGFNCAHYAISELNRLHGSDIKTQFGNDWQVEFFHYMRKWFTPLKTPVESCLVIMTQADNSLHFGVYRGYRVWHNFKPDSGAGSVVAFDMSTIKLEYKKVRFYAYNKTI